MAINYIYIYIYIYISELTVVTRVMQRSFNELSTSVSDYVKCKQTGVYTYTLNSLVNVGSVAD